MYIDLREALNIASAIARFGEVVAGTKSEVSLLKYVRGVIEEVSDEVKIEPVPVTAWLEEYCYVEYRGASHRCAIQPPYSGYIDLEFKRNDVVLFTYDKVLSKELPEWEIYDRVVVVETPRDPDDIATIATFLSTKKPRLLIFSDPHETIRRIVVLNKLIALYEKAEALSTPVVVLPSSIVKKLLEEPKARVLSSSQAFKSYGFNLVARKHGAEGSIYITAHHDHWLSGASDNILGVALAIALYKGIGKEVAKGISTSLVLFTAEEGFPETINSFYWLVGSRHFVAEHFDELFGEMIAAINMDAVYGEKPRIATSSPILIGVLKGLEPIDDDSIVFDSFSYTQAGLPALTLHAFQEVLTSGTYHSELDVIKATSADTVNVFAKRAMQVVKRLIEYSNRNELGEIEATLSSEIVKQGGVNLDVAEALYKFFKAVEKCSVNIIKNVFNTFIRISTKTFVDVDIGNRLGVREVTVLLKCLDRAFSIPVSGMWNVNECYRSYKFNISLLEYIICEVCSCEYRKAIR
jgi:Iap family predicted aminopeptidase